MRISAKGGLQPLPRPVRQVWTILHVACSVGWLGVLVACLTLRLSAQDAAAATLTRVIFLPATLLVLLTGVVLGLGTKWGLLRFYWVLTKLVIALVLLGIAALVTADLLSYVLLTTVTATATVLSITKPWGRVNWRRARSPLPQEIS
jgi:hypothetical protein